MFFLGVCGVNSTKSQKSCCCSTSNKVKQKIYLEVIEASYLNFCCYCSNSSSSYCRNGNITTRTQEKKND